MASAHYSKVVLVGLQKKGHATADVARITGTSVSKIQAILCEKSHFTDGNLAAIEEATGMSAGQLAMSTVDADESLKSVMNGWAALRSNKTKAPRRATRVRS